MQRSPRRLGLSLAAAAFVVAGLPSLAAPDDDDEAMLAKTRVKAREAGDQMRGAERLLAKCLESPSLQDAARRASDASSASLADLLRITASESRAASASIQWILDNAPQ